MCASVHQIFYMCLQIRVRERKEGEIYVLSMINKAVASSAYCLMLIHYMDIINSGVPTLDEISLLHVEWTRLPVCSPCVICTGGEGL